MQLLLWWAQMAQTTVQMHQLTTATTVLLRLTVTAPEPAGALAA